MSLIKIRRVFVCLPRSFNFFLFIIFITLFYLFLIIFLKKSSHSLVEHTNINETNLRIYLTNKTLSKFNNEKCIIPKLDLWSEKINKFYEEKNIINCGNSTKDWIIFKEQQLIINKDIPLNDKDFYCTITSIILIDDYNIKKNTKSINTFPFTDFESDFFHVYCYSKINYDKWNKYFMRAIVNKENIKKLDKRSDEKLNVHIISYDSLSQMAFRRLLPKTVKYFEEIMEGVVLNGYNIVGDGTPQAFIPILTGKTEIELPNTRKSEANSVYVDEAYDFIWNSFAKHNYVTAYGEDAFDIGTFQYRLKGFKNKPVTHYTRPSFQYTESLFGNDCFGKTPQHKEWLDYSTSIIEAYNQINISRFTLLHHSALSHDFTTKASNGDEDLYNNIKYNFENNNFENDIVILMADHGHRFAKFRETHQGQLEERLPFMGIYLPKKFRNTLKGKLFFRNLKINQNRLTTPFDLHESLFDILSPPNISVLEKIHETKKRGLSFFKEIPENRNCFDAGIEIHWCTCLQWTNIWNKPLYQSAIRIIGKTFVQEANKLLKPEISLCSPLKFDSILESSWLIPNSRMIHYKGSLDNDGFVPDVTGKTVISKAFIKVKLLTQPNGGIYELTVMFNFESNEMEINMWAVSHINKYGDNPHCIIDRIYKLATFCVCYDKINNV
uniref:Sulfatase N-terminal domain-containing protein n=1 Tax=Strongyloides stercoralis TaxID=6248 RepID=A0A0K0DV12_STRER